MRSRSRGRRRSVDRERGRVKSNQTTAVLAPFSTAIDNGPGKSDRPTVPGKSPNNARQPAAEGMGGKGLAKGNLLEQNASRTPSRKDAPSALERVRQAAKKDKQLRFTAL